VSYLALNLFGDDFVLLRNHEGLFTLFATGFVVHAVVTTTEHGGRSLDDNKGREDTRHKNANTHEDKGGLVGQVAESQSKANSACDSSHSKKALRESLLEVNGDATGHLTKEL